MSHNLRLAHELFLHVVLAGYREMGRGVKRADRVREKVDLAVKSSTNDPTTARAKLLGGLYYRRW